VDPTPRNLQRVYRHLGTSLSVTAPAEDLAWLEEFFGAALIQSEDSPALARICFGKGPPGEPGRHAGEPIVAFALDSGPVRLRPAPSAEGSCFISPWGRVTFTVCDAGRSTRIGYHSDRLSGRFYLMRVVREYAHNHAVRTEGLIVHAAGVTLDGSAIGIAGPPSAGKTTLLLRALARPHSAFLSNDRLLVRPERRPLALGVPSVIRLRPGTRELFPELTAKLRTGGDFRRHTAERDALGPTPPETFGEAWHLSAPQLCAALGRPVCASAPLSALLFLDPPGADSRPRRLSRDEASTTIANNLLGRRGSVLWSELFVATDDDVPSEAQILASCRNLAASIACVAGSRDTDLADVQALVREGEP
jgi:hypothetical protein